MGSPYDSFSTQFSFPQHNNADFRLRGGNANRFGSTSGFRPSYQQQGSTSSSSTGIGSITQILTFGVFIYVFFVIASIAQSAKDGGFRTGARANPFPNDNSNPQISGPNNISGPSEAATFLQRNASNPQQQQDPGKYLLTPDQQAEYQKWLLEKQEEFQRLQQQQQQQNSSSSSIGIIKRGSSGTIPSFEDEK